MLILYNFLHSSSYIFTGSSILGTVVRNTLHLNGVYDKWEAEQNSERGNVARPAISNLVPQVKKLKTSYVSPKNHPKKFFKT